MPMTTTSGWGRDRSAPLEERPEPEGFLDRHEHRQEQCAEEHGAPSHRPLCGRNTLPILKAHALRCLARNSSTSRAAGGAVVAREIYQWPPVFVSLFFAAFALATNPLLSTILRRFGITPIRSCDGSCDGVPESRIAQHRAHLGCIESRTARQLLEDSLEAQRRACDDCTRSGC